MAKTALHVLAAGMVLNRGALLDMGQDEFANTIETIRGAPKDKLLSVINDDEAFFNPKTLVKMIDQNDDRCLLVNEKIQFFTDAQMNALRGKNAIQGAVEGQLIHEHDGIVDLGNGNGYKYAAVPAGWSIGNNMSLGQTKIKRKIKNAEGDGTLFAVTPEVYNKIWEFASKAWSGVQGAPAQQMFQTYQGQKKATVMDDRVSIGGNFIRRYELEQVAKYRDWKLPIAA